MLLFYELFFTGLRGSSDRRETQQSLKHPGNLFLVIGPLNRDRGLPIVG